VWKKWDQLRKAAPKDGKKKKRKSVSKVSGNRGGGTVGCLGGDRKKKKKGITQRGKPIRLEKGIGRVFCEDEGDCGSRRKIHRNLG